ncbi:MAG: MjaI family restriction endonuclease [Clostridia bacterium]|nr:MjaI family restriction endonuclease [Clostridia bacterium]
MTIKISNEELLDLNGGQSPEFPKYTSQLINWANQNAQGTRPKVVGKLSDLFPEFEEEVEDISITSWKEWYLSKYPDAIDEATKKIWKQVENLKDAIVLIDEEMVRSWVEDLVITKTYNGLYFQQAILEKLSVILKLPYRLATAEEESKGIDGYVGDTAYSVKPDTYKSTNARSISDEVNVKMIYYTKKKTGITVEVEE